MSVFNTPSVEERELRRLLYRASLTIDTLLGMIETGDKHQGTREAAAVTSAEAKRLTDWRRPLAEGKRS